LREQNKCLVFPTNIRGGKGPDTDLDIPGNDGQVGWEKKTRLVLDTTEDLPQNGKTEKKTTKSKRSKKRVCGSGEKMKNLGRGTGAKGPSSE